VGTLIVAELGENPVEAFYMVKVFIHSNEVGIKIK
jgi:hypothetical protein